MAFSFKKRGQKIIRRFSRASAKASEEGKEHIKENFIDRLSHVKNIKLLIFEWSLLILGLIALSVAQAFWFGNSYAEDTFVAGGAYTEGTIGKVNSMNLHAYHNRSIRTSQRRSCQRSHPIRKWPRLDIKAQRQP